MATGGMETARLRVRAGVPGPLLDGQSVDRSTREDAAKRHAERQSIRQIVRALKVPGSTIGPAVRVTERALRGSALSASS